MFSLTEAVEGLGHDFISLRTLTPPYRALWATNGLIRRQIAVLEGHAHWVNAVAAAEYNGEPVLISGDDHGVLNIWSLNRRAVVKTLESYFTAHLADMYYVPSKRWLIAVGGGQSYPGVVYWDLGLIEQGSAPDQYQTFGNAEDLRSASCLCIWEAPQQAVIVVGTARGRLGVWDLNTGREIVEFATGGRAIDSVCAAEVDGRPVVVSGSRDGWLSVWNLLDGSLIRKQKAHRGGIYTLCFFMLDGRARFASGGADKKVKEWDFSSSAMIVESPKFSDVVHKILNYFSGGRHLFAVLGGNNLFFLDAQTGEIVSEYSGIGVYRAFGGACVVSDAGHSLVATADISGSVRLWEPSVMEEAPEAEPTDAVACLGADVASDLPFFFSVSRNAVELRDVRSGTVRRSFNTDFDRPRIITAAGDRIAIATGTQVAVVDRSSLQNVFLVEHEYKVSALTVRNIGGRSYMASGDIESRIAIFDLDSRKFVEYDRCRTRINWVTMYS